MQKKTVYSYENKTVRQNDRLDGKHRYSVVYKNSAVVCQLVSASMLVLDFLLLREAFSASFTFNGEA